MAKEREANFDRLLQTPDEPLYCLGCQKVFCGPMDDHGCPDCHVRAFVIPARSHADPLIAVMRPVKENEATEGHILSAPQEPEDALQKQRQRNR